MNDGSASTDRALDEVRAFLQRISTADELDERLEIPNASPAVQSTVAALNDFLDKLWVQSFQLSAKQEMLEKVVEIRTREVHEILDNVDAGFLLTIFDETVLDNYSRSCVEIFGTHDIKGKKLTELLQLSPSDSTIFSLSHQQIFEGVLPPEVSTGQLPSEFELNGRSYHIRGTHVCDATGKVAKVFFTINDNTELRKVEAENALRRALIEIVRQKESFASFLRETAKAFDKARRSPTQVRFRNVLHTLKGNLGCFGLNEIARLVHTIEDGPEITLTQLDLVENTLRKFLTSQNAVIGLVYPSSTQGVQRVELDRLATQLAKVVDEPEPRRRKELLAEVLRRSAWVQAEALIAPLRSTFERVSERLEKPATFEIKGQNVAVDPERLGSVFANL
ncbi:MAG TPA: Hpt domain-containing protein, partial [Polyangiales bacterium]